MRPWLGEIPELVWNSEAPSCFIRWDMASTHALAGIRKTGLVQEG